jgi:hypothetical protein
VIWPLSLLWFFAEARERAEQRRRGERLRRLKREAERTHAYWNLWRSLVGRGDENV